MVRVRCRVVGPRGPAVAGLKGPGGQGAKGKGDDENERAMQEFFLCSWLDGCGVGERERRRVGARRKCSIPSTKY